MISAISEIQDIFLIKARNEDDPIFKRPYLLLSPGYSKTKIEKIKEIFIDFPLSYLRILESYKVNGVIISNFELSPYSFDDEDALEGLIKSYNDPFFPKEFMEKHKMYQIGTYNTDLICITTGTDQFKEGEILFVEEGYDIYNPQDNQIHKIAKDFEQFLIIAGNLGQIRGEIKEDESNWEIKKSDFIQRLKLLKVDEDYQKFWMSFL